MIGIVVFLALFYSLSMFLVLIRDRNGILMNAYNIILFAFVGVFCILFPIAYLFSSLGYVDQIYATVIVSMDAIDIVYYYLIIGIVSHCFFAVLRRNKVIISDRNFYDIEVENNGKDPHCLRIAILLLFIGLVCDALYLRAYGSFENYLLYSKALRSGVLSVNNPFSFLITFRKCINISSYILFSQLYSKSSNKPIIFILFGVSFFFACRAMYADGGRLAMIIYFLVLVIFSISKRTKKMSHIKGKTIGIGLAILAIFLIACFWVGSILSRNSSTNFILEIVNEFSFLFVNFANVVDSFSFDDARFFLDTILFPVFLLPSRLWDVQWNIHTASEFTTILLHGAEKGNNGVMGEMPIDLISLSYVQFGIIGIVVIPIVYAFFFCKMYEFAKKIKDSPSRDIMSIYVFILLGIQTIFYADPQHITRRAFALILFYLLMLFVPRIKINIRTKRTHR